MTRPRRRAPPGQTRARILAFVRDCLERGHPPTIREVQAAVGLRALESVREQLAHLVEDGALVKEDGVARGWRLPGQDNAHTRYVPLLGHVPAGDPTEALEEHEGVVPFDMRRA